MGSRRRIYQILNRPPGAKTAMPVGRSIVAGFAVFALLVGVPLAFDFVSYSAGMAALVALGVMALAFGYRSGLRSVLGAAFVALAPAALAVGAVDDYRRVNRLHVIDAPVGELSYKQMADIFVPRDFRVAAEFANVRRTYRTVGGPPQAEYFGVAPIVPASWSKGQAVPAWLACTGTEEGWCQKVFAQPLRAATRADGRRSMPIRRRQARRRSNTASPCCSRRSCSTMPSRRTSGAAARSPA